MKTYVGVRTADGTAHVLVEEDGVRRPLRHVVYHSPTGLEWGYGGSGPADLEEVERLLWAVALKLQEIEGRERR